MQTVLIFGASSGIGKETGKRFYENGYKVFNTSRTEAGDIALTDIRCDVTRPDDVERAVSTAAAYTGQLDYMIYSAGVSMAAPIEYAREADWRYLFEVNFFGFVRAVRAALPCMRDGGRILAVGSVAGTVPVPFDSWYSASKAALDMFIRAANFEVNEKGIYLTSVRAGGTATEFTFKRTIYSPEEAAEYDEKLKKAVTALAAIEQGGMSPQSVAETVYDCALHKTEPETTVGFVNAAYSAAERWLPDKVTDFFIRERYFQ